MSFPEESEQDPLLELARGYEEIWQSLTVHEQVAPTICLRIIIHVEHEGITPLL